MAGLQSLWNPQGTIAQVLAQLVGLDGAAAASATNPLPTTALVDPFPNGATPVCDSSGNVANAVAVATLPAVVGKTTYVKSVTFSPGGATAAAEFIATIASLSNAGVTKTLSYIVGAPLGATVVGSPITVTFGDGFPAFQANQSIVASMPALGVGNTNAAVSITGYYK